MKKPFRMDAIAAAYNLDASESINVENELLAVRAKLYEQKFPELIGLSLVPPEETYLDPGANNFTYDHVKHYATVQLHTGMGRRGPRAALERIRATPIPFVSKTNSYGYSVQDIRAAALANTNRRGAGLMLDFELAKAARRAFEMWRDDVLLIADGTADWDGLTGLFMLSGVDTYTVPNGAAGSPLWADKTPDEMLADLHGMCNQVMTNTNGVEVPRRTVLPLSLYTDAATRELGDGRTGTVLERFLAVRSKMTPGYTVVPCTKSETIGAASGTRSLAYDPEQVRRLDSVEFEQMQPQVEAFETITDCHSRSAGVYTPYPKSLITADGM